jgi:xanthine dehydrogenase large subunit
MLAISVWLAIRDAISSLADHRVAAQLDAPATPEQILTAVDRIRAHG